MNKENMKAYKSAGNYIIELEIPEDALTNLDRQSVVDKSHAKFRCDKAFVTKIQNKDNSNDLVNSIQSDYDKNFIYEMGKLIVDSNYDKNIDAICTDGIHFYLSEEAAFFHNNSVIDGIGKKWYDNG